MNELERVNQNVDVLIVENLENSYYDKVYYSLNNVVVRNSVKEDIDALADKLKQSDIDEIWASHNHRPKEALELSLSESSLCLTIEDNGNVIGMFGICPQSFLGTKAIIWLLSSEDLFDRKYRFIRHSRYFIELFLEMYPYLENYVDNRNVKSIRWLKACGAIISDPVHYGVEKMPFRHFYFEK